MKSPKVSFIVPVYGVEQYLRKCLGSIEGQTLRDWECVLVDDGSPDGSGVICDEYASYDPRFRVIHKKNAGVSAARNDGIDAAGGEWAYLVDSDDWLEVDAAERLLEAAETHRVDCVMSYSEMVEEGRDSVMSPAFSEAFVARGRDELDELQKYVLYGRYSRHYTSRNKVGYAAPWGKFVKLSVLHDNDVRFDPYLRGVFDDGLYSLHLLEYCNSLYYLHEKTYNYRIVSGSLTHSFKPDAMETQRRGYERIEQFLRETNKDKSFWEAYYAHIVTFFGGYLSRYYFNEENPKSRREINAEIVRELSTEPFVSAAEMVDISMLRAKDKWLALCERKRFLTGLKAYFCAKKLSESRVPRIIG